MNAEELATRWEAEAARLRTIADEACNAPGARGQSYAFAECARELSALAGERDGGELAALRARLAAVDELAREWERVAPGSAAAACGRAVRAALGGERPGWPV